MKLKNIKNVMKLYKKAWENQDIQLIQDCFTKKGTYQESPLTKPYKGHKEIKNFWKIVVVKNTKNIKFKLKKCYLSNDKKTGFAEWECKNSFRNNPKSKWEKGHMVGIMILKMKGEKIIYLNEYWKTKIN